MLYYSYQASPIVTKGRGLCLEKFSMLSERSSSTGRSSYNILVSIKCGLQNFDKVVGHGYFLLTMNLDIVLFSLTIYLGSSHVQTQRMPWWYVIISTPYRVKMVTASRPYQFLPWGLVDIRTEITRRGDSWNVSSRLPGGLSPLIQELFTTQAVLV